MRKEFREMDATTTEAQPNKCKPRTRKRGDIAAELAKEFGCSRRTIINAGRYAEALERIGSVDSHFEAD